MKLTLQRKIIVLGVGATIIPIIILTALMVGNNLRLGAQVGRQLHAETREMLEGMARQIYDLCKVQNDAARHIMVANLKIAEDVLARQGGLHLLPEKVTWQAVNQFTQAAATLELPRVAAGQDWLGQTTDRQAPVKVVDEVARLVGGTCTIFQRFNSAGDMLRVATNVLKQDQTRAIGTFIPVRNPDGQDNPVLKDVLAGKPFIGRAFVVDSWYITAYQPVKDVTGQVIGMLYVGIKQMEIPGAPSLREAIQGTKVGTRGYAYVLGASGPDRGKYIISQDGKRDGESLWESKDSQGKLFIQELITESTRKGPRETGFFEYLWQNPGDAQPSPRLAAVAYFRPWDWVIGINADKAEMEKAGQEVNAAFKSLLRQSLLAGLVLLILTGVGAVFFARSFSRPIHRAISGLKTIGGHVNQSSQQVSGTSQQLAAMASQNAATLAETTSSLEEMAAMTRQNAENAREADRQMNNAGQVVAQAEQQMQELAGAMGEISQASSETAKIIKTIDEIAFQTNLLALNAAVEAARAGEAGAGFAVVADEVRNLALRAAEAAKNTADLIEETVGRVTKGGQLAHHTQDGFSQVSAYAQRVQQLIGEIAGASAQQAQGVEQISLAMAEMDKVVQQNALSAESGAGEAGELLHQARKMGDFITELTFLVAGSRNHDAPAEPQGQSPAAAAARLPAPATPPTAPRLLR